MLIVYWPHNVSDSRITHAYAPKTAVLYRIGQKKIKKNAVNQVISAFCGGSSDFLVI